MRHLVSHRHKPPSPSPSPKPSLLLFFNCKHHSPSATLDLLILILAVFSATFLLSSYLSYIFNSISLLLLSHHLHSLHFLISFLAFLALSLLLLWGSRSRRCHNPSCKGLRKASEFDLQLHSEEDCLNSSSSKLFHDLPWKGGSEANPDYECLRSELRKMAPANGRAVLLFRSRCGCPVAKLEGWGHKRPRRTRKALAGVAQNGDHR